MSPSQNSSAASCSRRQVLSRAFPHASSPVLKLDGGRFTVRAAVLSTRQNWTSAQVLSKLSWPQKKQLIGNKDAFPFWRAQQPRGSCVDALASGAISEALAVSLGMQRRMVQELMVGGWGGRAEGCRKLSQYSDGCSKCPRGPGTERREAREGVPGAELERNDVPTPSEVEEEAGQLTRGGRTWTMPTQRPRVAQLGGARPRGEKSSGSD